MQVEEFDPVSPEQFTKVTDGLRAKGLNITGTHGEIRQFGADVRFDFVAPKLTITVVSAPHFHNLQQFSAQVHDAVSALLET